MGKKILMAVGGVVVLFLAAVATRPAKFHIERSATVAAPPAIAFAQVNDFHRWAEWSPWDKMDPSMKKTYEGPAAGVGSMYSWLGNDKVGEGKMTITESTPGAKVTLKLEFIKPFAATNMTTFTFAPEGEGTKVTWAMDGDNNFMSKAMQMFMSMDKMVGPDFERGLSNLNTVSATVAKAEAEKAAADKAAAEAAAKAEAEKAAAEKAAADAAAAEAAAKASKGKKKK